LVPADSVSGALLPARYRVWCGALAVEADAAFDEAVLRRLLSIVAAC
jgi:hypothetical protein